MLTQTGVTVEGHMEMLTDDVQSYVVIWHLVDLSSALPIMCTANEITNLICAAKRPLEIAEWVSEHEGNSTWHKPNMENELGKWNPVSPTLLSSLSDTVCVFGDWMLTGIFPLAFQHPPFAGMLIVSQPCSEQHSPYLRANFRGGSIAHKVSVNTWVVPNFPLAVHIVGSGVNVSASVKSIT